MRGIAALGWFVLGVGVAVLINAPYKRFGEDYRHASAVGHHAWSLGTIDHRAAVRFNDCGTTRAFDEERGLFSEEVYFCASRLPSGQSASTIIAVRPDGRPSLPGPPFVTLSGQLGDS